jgi:SsrA-binding protein
MLKGIMEAIRNKQARFDYEILEKFEAGLELFGYEVKSIKKGLISIKNAFVTLKSQPKTELFLTNANISKYQQAGTIPHFDPTRSRKLLLHKREINYLIGKLQQKGLTLVPLSVYASNNRVKLEFGLAKGKKKFDKRETIKRRELDREIHRTLKSR